ncbi:GH39 family glycosyl hydrolase [Clostridium lacusfryxellense]|uniref:GH39 family glycosyl hydrolase n=1 Tax=Clostridium lacusfryxellense TaxID=205328 RepID=UPI001C0A9B3A|nr:fibronectin type III domain-containing protein [Clostridium lacusfryxellense]MBU3113409.1 hypothetical protein [Clostridium lacusfryxellense]
MKKIMSLLVTLLMVNSLFSPIVKASTTTQPVSTVVNVSTDWNKVVSSATSLSYGINGFQAFNPTTVNNQKYQDNMRYMNVGIIRYHSWEMVGESSNNNGWIKTVNGVPTWDATKIKLALDGMSSVSSEKMIDIPGTNSEWGWLDSTGCLKPEKVADYVKLCADLVKIVNVDLGLKVKLWEPMNEWDDKYYVQFANAGTPDRLNEMIDIYNQCSKAMKAIDPTIQTGGASFARGDLYDQISRFVDGTLPEGTLDYLSYHFYGSGDLGASDQTIYNRVSTPADATAGTLEKHTKDIRNILDTKSPNKHIPLWCDEYNISWSWTNNDPRMQNYKGGVFDALSLIYASKSGADCTTAWNEFDGVYGKMDNDMNLRPSANVFQMFNNYMIGDVVESTSDQEGKIVSLAVENGEDSSIAIVNRSNETQIVKVNSKGAGIKSGIVKQHQLNEYGYSIKDTYWANATIEGILVPANSVTVITDSSKEPTIMPATVPEKAPGVSSNPTNDDQVDTTPSGSGIKSNVAFGDTANLTTLGNLDWAHWGGNVADVSGIKTAQIISNRKAGITNHIISDLEVTGIEKHAVVTDNTGYKVSYSDGTEPTSEVDDNKGFSFGPQGDAGDNPGVKFTVKAGTKQRTVSILVGVKGSKAKLTAKLNDGSNAVYESNVDDAVTTPLSLNNSGWISNYIVTLTYSAVVDNTTMTIELNNQYNHWGKCIDLYGAAVSEADTTKPSIPQNLSTVGVSKDEAAIKWNSSTDNMGVSGYRVYSGGELIGTTNKDNTNFYWNGLRPNSKYLFTVKAIDATGNISGASETLAVTTKAVPTHNTVVLSLAIKKAQALYDSAEKGTGNGNAVGLKAKLQSAITHAKTLVTNALATSQRDIDLEVTTLNASAKKLSKHYIVDKKKEK